MIVYPVRSRRSIADPDIHNLISLGGSALLAEAYELP